MQTTLRINDSLYREAKAEAARSGITLTQFIEDALAMRLRQPKVQAPIILPVYSAGAKVGCDFDLLLAIRESNEDERVRLEKSLGDESQ